MCNQLKIIMNMVFRALLLIITLVSPLVNKAGQRAPSQEEVIRNIVFMRSEGLSMTLLLLDRSQGSSLMDIGNRVKSYYEWTQEETLNLCKGKQLNLSSDQFDLLYSRLQKGLLSGGEKTEYDYLKIYDDHITKNIAYYMNLLKERKYDEVTYFSLRALPELFNIQKEVKTLLQRVDPNK